MKKKIIALCLIVSMLAIAVISGTIAYFTDVEDKDNTFVIGDIDIAIKESNGVDADNGANGDGDGYDNWLDDQVLFPGVPVKKIVTVKNVGENSAYVRVTLTVPQYMNANFADGYTNDWTQISKTTDADNNTVYVFKYNTELAKGAETEALLDNISVDKFIDDELNAKDALNNDAAKDVNVYAEAIQTAGFADVDAALAALDAQKARDVLDEVTDGLYSDDEGNFYVYNAEGLAELNEWIIDNKYRDFYGKTYNIMDNIDATDVTWNTMFLVPNAASFDGITFNGNGHTISNLTINGNGLFSGTPQGSDANTAVTSFNNITFDNVTVNGGTHHVGVVWGEAYGSVTLNKVNVINSKVTGGCNVGGLVGRNSESLATFTFTDCSVKNTVVNATQVSDYAGASAFLGMALKTGDDCAATVVFEGTNVSDGNTLNTAVGMQGGGIYAVANYGDATWTNPTVVTSFTNHSFN